MLRQNDASSLLQYNFHTCIWVDLHAGPWGADVRLFVSFVGPRVAMFGCASWVFTCCRFPFHSPIWKCRGFPPCLTSTFSFAQLQRPRRWTNNQGLLCGLQLLSFVLSSCCSMIRTTKMKVYVYVYGERASALARFGPQRARLSALLSLIHI